MMRVLGRPSSLLVLAAFYLLSGVVSAQDAEVERTAEDLSSELFFLEKLDGDFPDAGFDAVWPTFVATAEKQYEEHKPHGGLEDVYARACLGWAKALEKRDRTDDALANYEKVLVVDPERDEYGEAALAAGRIHEARGKAILESGDEMGALGEFEAAMARFEQGRDDTARERARSQWVKLKSARAFKAAEARDYDLAIRLFEEAAADIPDFESTDAARKLADLKANTGVLAVKTIPVGIDGRDVIGGAEMRLIPPSGEEAKAWQGTAAGRLRWDTGRYTVTLAFGSEPPCFRTTVDLGPGGASFEVPAKMPAGMVFVPRVGDVKPFLIDRTEVTIRDFSSGARDGDLPARGMTWADAEGYASSVGKKLPTYEQWRAAAFGGLKRDFPWGDEDWKGRATFGVDEPRPVGSWGAAGASPCGALDMAGNVWEWLRDKHAIGGSYRTDLDRYRKAGWNPLKDERPDESLPQAEERKYRQYSISEDSRKEVGLRCVLELE
jgi:tetratricopeptide (TPR) repeat protein